MRLLLLSLVLTLSACASTRTSWTYETTRIIAGSSEDVTAIFEQSRAFSAAYVRGDIDELVSIYAEDGIAAPGGRDFVRGHEALREFWQIAPGVDIQHHKMTPEELWIDGDLAYDWGYYEGTSQRGDAEPSSFRGKYLVVWQRDADGVWRLANDMWNSLSQT